MIKTIIGIGAASFACCLTAGAQALPSLLIPSNPESAAIAATSVAREASAFAVDDNAASISLSDKKFAVGASWNYWSPSTSGTQIAGIGAFVRTGKRIGIGFSGKYSIEKPMDITSSAGGILGSFTPSEFSGSLAVSVKTINGLSAAVTGKVIRSSIGEELSGTAFGADLSLAWKGESVSAGAAVCNVGSKISYGDRSYALPMLVKAGAAYSAFGLTASIEADYLFSGAFAAGLGLEYNILDIGFIRAGYHYGQESEGLPSFASAGLGVRFTGFEVAATWITASKMIGNSVLVGLAYSF